MFWASDVLRLSVIRNKKEYSGLNMLVFKIIVANTSLVSIFFPHSLRVIYCWVSTLMPLKGQFLASSGRTHKNETQQIIENNHFGSIILKSTDSKNSWV